MTQEIRAWGWRWMMLAALLVAGGPSGAQQARVNAESESRLRDAIAYLRSGTPNYQDMEPMLRIAVEQQSAAVKSRLAGLGPLQQLEFVGPQGGADVYKATFQNGVTSWAIQISPNGKLAALYFQ